MAGGSIQPREFNRSLPIKTSDRARSGPARSHALPAVASETAWPQKRTNPHNSRHVRFVPKANKQADVSVSLLCATSRHCGWQDRTSARSTAQNAFLTWPGRRLC